MSKSIPIFTDQRIKIASQFQTKMGKSLSNFKPKMSKSAPNFRPKCQSIPSCGPNYNLEPKCQIRCDIMVTSYQIIKTDLFQFRTKCQIDLDHNISSQKYHQVPKMLKSIPNFGPKCQNLNPFSDQNANIDTRFYVKAARKPHRICVHAYIAHWCECWVPNSPVPGLVCLPPPPPPSLFVLTIKWRQSQPMLIAWNNIVPDRANLSWRHCLHSASLAYTFRKRKKQDKI